MADNERTITTVFQADISQFSASTQDLNKYVKTVNSEFKNATASLDRWNDNTTGLTAKITQLNKTLEAEEKKLGSLESAYDELVKAGKENTKEAQNLAIQINNQSAKVKETQKNIDKYTDSLKELEDAGVDTKDELKEVNKKLDEQKTKAKETGDALLKGAGVGLAGLATACVGAVAGLTSLVDETKELRTQLGQLETAFVESGLNAEDATNTYDELYSVLGDSGKATEASLQLGQLAKNEKELKNYTNILTGVYATFGDSLPVEGLAEAMNHTANLGSVQGNLADALEWSGINVDDFNEQLAALNTEEERAKLISDTLNGIYGETATKYKEVNEDIINANDSQNEYNKTMADIGKKVQPAITSFKGAMVEVLATILKKFDEVDIDGIVEGIGDAITNITEVVLPPLIDLISWVLDNLPALAVLMGAVTTAIVAQNVATTAKTLIDKAATGQTTLLGLAQQGLNNAFRANPIGIVITAVGLLVTAFMLLWKNCEGFRNFFINMWDSIKKIAKNVATFIGDTFKSVINTVKGVINGVISLINGAIRMVNKIKVDIPDWVPVFGGKTFGLNLKQIPLLARGGIVDSPTLAMIGEAGKEAVVPLENNMEWLDKLAEKINAKQPTTYNITNKFEKMETSRLALHQSNLEMKRLLEG